MKKLLSIIFLFSLIAGLYSCDDDEGTDATTDELKLNITGLENLGDDYHYEGWIIVSGTPVSTGTFDVDDAGALSKTSFTVNTEQWEDATAFVVSIEPTGDSDPAPSNVHILAGDLTDGSGSLSVGHSAAINDDFSAAAGTYILATPTNGEDSNENSGIWFLNPEPTPSAGLMLPTLPAGWKYEGWSVIDDVPVSTGKFTAVDMADDADTYSGDEDGPTFPGEDFLVAAPSGLTFPTDLAGTTAVISIEPDPDNSTAPFSLKPLQANVSATAVDHTPYSLSQNLGSLPTGTVSK
jgi:hypothetical protein